MKYLKTYIYDGIEVIKTGRRAVKNIKTIAGIKEEIIYQIKPVDNEVTWNKWVSDTDLYVVVDK